jgi:hypothetical protein
MFSLNCSSESKIQISTLFPGLFSGKRPEKEYFKGSRFHGASRMGSSLGFPVLIKDINDSKSSELERTECLKLTRLRIISMSHLEGMIIVHENGLIQSANDAFVRYLFGWNAGELSKKRSIDTIIPQAYDLILQAKPIPRPGIAHSETIMGRNDTNPNSSGAQACRFKAGISFSSPNSPKSPLEQNLVALHRDGTRLLVNIVIRAVISESVKPVYAFWIRYEHQNPQFSFKEEPSRLSTLVAPTLPPRASNSESNAIIPANFKGLNWSLNKILTSIKQPITSTNTEISKNGLNNQTEPSIKRTTFDVINDLENKIEKEPNLNQINQLSYSLATNREDRNPQSIPKSDKTALAPTNQPESVRFDRNRTLADYELTKKLGEGTFGFVHSAFLRSDPKKVTNKRDLTKDFLREIYQGSSQIGRLQKNIEISIEYAFDLSQK